MTAAPAFLGRCDPTVLLVTVVAVPIALLRVYAPVPLLALWLAAAVGVMAAGRVTARRLLTAQLPFVAFGLSLVMVNSVTRGGRALAAWGPLTVTDLGLRTGTALALRTVLIGVCAVGFLASTEPARLLTSLHLVARLPVRVSCAVLAAHRVLDDLPVEWSTIRRAHAVRAPAAARRRLSRSPAALGRAAFTLLASAIRRAERVAISLESRALGALGRDERTTWQEARVGHRDVLLVAVVAAALTATVVAGRTV